MLNSNDLQNSNNIYINKLPQIIANLGLWDTPTSFDNSASWYQALKYVCEYMLNKLIPHMQQNDTEISELTTLYNEIKSYVDNLDVQEEINNKLDKMAQDGTLADIINNDLLKNINDNIESLNETTAENTKNINKTTNDFNTFKSETNTTLNNINNKVNSVTSGTPIPVNSIGEMSDTSKIYVLTTDGKWYYYNESNWVAGGVYQATGLSDNQVKSNNIENIEFEKVGLTNLGITVDDFSQWNNAGTIIKNDDGSITYNKTQEKDGGVQLTIPTQNKDVYIVLNISANYSGNIPYYLFISSPSIIKLYSLTEGINIYKIDKQYTNISQTILISNSIIDNITINSISVFAGNIDEK